MKKFIRLAALLLALLPVASKAQFPQAPSQITFNANSAFVGGWSPSFSYNPSATSLLPAFDVSLNGGTVTACGSLQQIPAQTLALTASSNNFIFINVSAACAVQVNQTGFTLASQIPLYEITTNASGVSTNGILDVRTFLYPIPTSGSSFCPIGGCAFTGPISGTTATFTTLDATTVNAVTTNGTTATFTTLDATTVNAGTTNSPVMNNVFWPATPTALISDIATSTCTSGCTVIVSTALGFTQSVVMPSTVALEVVGSGNINLGSGITFTINGSFVAPRSQVFDVTTGFSFGAKVNTVYPEWFGAHADWNGTTGTNNTTLIQASLNSLTAGSVVLTDGTYMVSSALSITRSSIGIQGINQGPSADGHAASVIINTSATADTIDVAGASQAAMIEWNRFENFAIQRSRTPTGCSISPSSFATGAAGISIVNVGGVIMTGMHISDNCRDVYMNGSPGFGTGLIYQNQADWGETGLTYPNGLSVCGFCIDSTNGVPMNSQTFSFDGVSNAAGSGITTYAFLMAGSAINDVETDWFFTALDSYGIYVQCTGNTLNNCADVHFVNSVLDGAEISAAFVTGINVTGDGALDFRGGHFDNNASTAPTVDIENSSGVKVIDGQITGVAASAGILLNGDNNVTAQGNTIINMLQGITVNNTQSSSINNNNVHNDTQRPISSAIEVQNGSSNNVIEGNAILADPGEATIQGMGFDSSTVKNVVGDNSIVGYTTRINDMGTNNATFAEPGLIVGFSGSKFVNIQNMTVTGCTAAASGTCSFNVTFPNTFPDATYTVVCGVDSSTGIGVITGNNAQSTTTVNTNFVNLTAASNTLTRASCIGWE